MVNILKLFDSYHNPWYYWWKARKWFKRPRAHFVCGEFHGYFGLPIRIDYYGVLNFFCVGLGWKEKFGSPRHEWDPIICVVLVSPFKTKRKFRGSTYYAHRQYWLGWVFNWVRPLDRASHTASMATWEAILDVVVYGRSIGYARENHVWSSNNTNDLITIDNNLKNGEPLQQ